MKKKIEIDERDLKIETYRTDLGVHNKYGEGIRITHLPTGTIGESSREENQTKNRIKAMIELREELAKIPVNDDEKGDTIETLEQFAFYLRHNKVVFYRNRLLSCAFVVNFQFHNVIMDIKAKRFCRAIKSEVVK